VAAAHHTSLDNGMLIFIMGVYTQKSIVVTEIIDLLFLFSFEPVNKKISVWDSPIKGLIFSELRAELQGKIDLIGKAGGGKMVVKLKNQDGRVVGVASPSSDGHYTFKDFSPGSYFIHVESSVYCFPTPTKETVVSSPKVTAPPIKNTGFVLKLRASHETPIDIYNTKREKVSFLDPVLSF